MNKTRYYITPYGIWYYGAILDKLVEKLENALRMIIYLPPDIRAELETLSELELIEDFEDIGKWARDWINSIRGRILDWNSCKNLYESAVSWKIALRERVNEYILLKPRLQKLDEKKLIKEMKELPEDPRIREWLKADENRIKDFREGCNALIYGLPTAAGFYFMRLCERALRELFKKIHGETSKKTWGEILDMLEQYYKDRQRPEILHILSYLRNIRNKIMHPDQFLTQEEAETLYVYTMDVIRRLKELLGELER